MNQVQPNPNDNPDSSGDVPLKRKRGRPRKHPKPHAEVNANIRSVQNVNQNPVSGGNAGVPPGFDRVNGNQPRQRDLENDLDDPMVGQVVSCVIEAVFDAGYLLSAKVGNSNTTLRGLVLKPGHYAPISSENDVAPGVPMIQRNEVPFSAGSYTQVQNPHRKRRNKQYVNIHRNDNRTPKGSPSVSQLSKEIVSSSNLVASQGKNLPSTAEQTSPLLSRGNVVPVMLQPVNSPSGVLVSNQSSQVMTQASLGSGSSVAKEIPADGNQEPFSQIQTSHNVLPRGMQNEDGQHNQSSVEVLHEVEAKSMRLPSMPFEKLVTEVVKRIETPSQSIDPETNNSKSVEKMSAKDSSSRQEEKVNDVGQPLLIKPLQAVQAGSQDHSTSDSRPSENIETGKMTDQSQASNTRPSENIETGKMTDQSQASNTRPENIETGKMTDQSQASNTRPENIETGKMTDRSQVLQDDKIENQASKAEELGSGHKLDGIRNSDTAIDEKIGQSA